MCFHKANVHHSSAEAIPLFISRIKAYRDPDKAGIESRSEKSSDPLPFSNFTATPPPTEATVLAPSFFDTHVAFSSPQPCLICIPLGSLLPSSRMLVSRTAARHARRISSFSPQDCLVLHVAAMHRMDSRAVLDLRILGSGLEMSVGSSAEYAGDGK